jgi:hypothetical protein
MNKIDNDAQTAVLGQRHGKIEPREADQRLSVHDIVANVLTCEGARTSILFRATVASFVLGELFHGAVLKTVKTVQSLKSY